MAASTTTKVFLPLRFSWMTRVSRTPAFPTSTRPGSRCTSPSQPVSALRMAAPYWSGEGGSSSR